MKQCKKCGEEKPLDGFYKVSKCGATDSSCKDCRKARVRQNRSEKLDYYRDYDRKRGNRHQPGYVNEYRKKYAIKSQAHNRVNRALVSGVLSKPDSCEQCGDRQSSLHAHHDDYTKQLDVRWLCPGCHHQWHAKHGEAKNAGADPLPFSRITAAKSTHLEHRV